MERLTDEYLTKICKDNGYTFIRSFDKTRDTNQKRIDRYMEVIHDKCGKQYSCRIGKFIYESQRCTCSRKQKYASINTIEEYNNKLKELYGDEYTAVGIYYGSHKPVEIRHKCGYTYTVSSAGMMIYQETKCPVCAKHKKRTKDEAELYLRKQGFNLKILDYSDKQNPLIQNLDCGHEYKININDYIINRKPRLICPICEKHGSSSYEFDIINYIKSFYDKRIIHKYRDNNKEIDIYLPEDNLGIEIDGLYWHSEVFCNSSYHKEKTKYFLSKGIRILHIFENELIDKKDIVFDKIRSILQCNSEKVYARSCEIINLAKQDGNSFLDINHIQSQDNRGTFYYGLKYNNEIIAVMCFAEHRGHGKDKISYDKSTIELTRYATKLGTNVIGGFSKLLKHFEQNNKYDQILSFADLRYTNPNNNVYLKNNFVIDHITKPSYYYTKGTSLLYKYSFRKSELKKKKNFKYDENKTEKENMVLNGYHYIHDCGLIAYMKQIKKDRS